MENSKKKGVLMQVANPKLVAKEAPKSHKDVYCIINLCEITGARFKVENCVTLLLLRSKWFLMEEVFIIEGS